MYINDALRILGINRPELARWLGVSNQALSGWIRRDNGLIPRDRACYLQVITQNRITVDLDLYE